MAVAENDTTTGAVGSANADSGTPDQLTRVLLCWPIFQALYPRPFQNFAEILIAAGRQTTYLFGVKVYERTLLVPAMNDLGEIMRRGQWDACIIFDDDCFPPYDVIPRLLQRCFVEGHPFVGAVGTMRGYPWTTTAAKSYPEGVSAVTVNGKVQCAGFTWLDDIPEELVEVDFCGFPAVIIHRRIFEAIVPPWFGDVDEIGARVTHDTYFCKKAKDAGFALQVDGTIRCGHLVEPPVVTFENRAQAREIMKVAAP